MQSTIKQILYKPYAIYKIWRRLKNNNNNFASRIFLLNIPSHGNLGDHLLSVAEQQFLHDNFPGFFLVPVTSADLYYSTRCALSAVKVDDILCITGGGFLGSLYQEETRFMKILTMFPKNKIIVFPQTIYYENNEKGKRMLSKAITNYQRHKKLFVIARDQNTYNLLCSTLMKGRESNIALTPDMALYMHYNNNAKREGILWCMRRDVEINEKNNEIISLLREQVSNIEIKESDTDTYVQYSISLDSEKQEVLKKINQFSKAQLVITDRLHGMIYSVITSTPVIAMDNMNGKIGLVYKKWICHVPYVRFVTTVDEVQSAFRDLLTMTNCQYNNTSIKKQYQPIIDFINA